MSERPPLVVGGAGLAELAARLGLPLGEAGEAELSLEIRDGRLVLVGDPRRYGNPLAVDFVAGRAAHRRHFGGGRGQLIARACGLGKGVTPSVVDATAGLGRDAFVLASLGAEVLMVERVAAIFALLEDGVARALADPETAGIAARMHLARGDATRELDALVAEGGVSPQVVHLDPMFPHRDKSALVKKEMRLFRVLAGDDGDAPRLLEAALDVATHRVVVKRPRQAPPIAGPAPRHVIEGKTSRYDLYVHRALTAA
ncbi:class I SAM-dependent methyltransferase [Halomonas heilongjiangensis]|uniref:Ribosomal RNA small subunit methyltransferase J n=1 Tax=Halomonas heilongjiangensis TaxID=1387883 RepID=A0A2N7TPG0_9GAMM|nr:class I SAM-dependent methyltransferase [Halomonas heilongjiangensis]PMR70065.1 rRNA methyltransferase [Halomonas heilongjiangensis]PXX94429.1 rRNA methyltransferase [Halomonas heilongjiangensis]